MADRLKRARKALDLTQQEVADRLDVHVMSVSGWERGLFEPEPDKLSALASLYGTTPSVLRDGAMPMPADGELFRRVAEGPPAYRPILRVMLQAAANQPGHATERIAEFMEECARAGASDAQVLAVRSYLLGALEQAIADARLELARQGLDFVHAPEPAVREHIVQGRNEATAADEGTAASRGRRRGRD